MTTFSPPGAGWLRVNREYRCPICDRPDWCLIAADGSAAICARIGEGAARHLGDCGWLHRLRDPEGWRPPMVRRVVVPPAAASRRDLAGLDEAFRAAADPARVAALARDLGVSDDSLRRLAIGWCARSSAWSFPMRSATGDIVGIRLRMPAGRKFSVRGSHEGLFIPAGLETSDRLLIAEGPTDVAALLDAGCVVVGRPSCRGGIGHLVGLARRLRPVEIVIVADGDAPGRNGADALAGRLVALARRIRIVTPPDGVKDAREWARRGSVRANIEAAIEAAPPLRITARARLVAPTRAEGEVRRG